MRISHSLRAGLATIVASALFVSPVTVLSQPLVRPCGPDGPGLLNHLQKQGEKLDAVGFTASGKLVYVLVNPDDRQYSIITVAPDNEGCFISLGTDWEWLEPGQ